MTLVDLDFQEQLKETNFPDLLSAVPAKRKMPPSQQQKSRVARAFNVASLRPNVRNNGRTDQAEQPRPDAPRRDSPAVATHTSSAAPTATTMNAAVKKTHSVPLQPPVAPSSPYSSATSSSGRTSVRSPVSHKDDDDLLLDALLVPLSKQPAGSTAKDTAAASNRARVASPPPSRETLHQAHSPVSSTVSSGPVTKRGDLLKQTHRVVSPAPHSLILQQQPQYPLTPQRSEATAVTPTTSPRSDFLDTVHTAESSPISPLEAHAHANHHRAHQRYEAEGLFLDDELLCIIPRNRSSVSSLREGENDHVDDGHDDNETVASTENAVVVDHTHRLNITVQSAQESDESDNDSRCSQSSSDDGAKLLEKAKDRIARQNLFDEVVVLKATIDRKNGELENLHGQLRRAVATKCDLVIAHNELEKTHAQAMQRKESNLQRMKQANVWLLEAQSLKEKELINEIVRLTDLVKDTEQKHRDELDDWERMHRNEMLEKDFEIAKLSEELRRSSMTTPHQPTATRRPFVTSKFFLQ